MQSSKARLQELFDRWRNDVSTPEEMQELVSLLSTEDLKENAEPLLERAWDDTNYEPVFTAHETNNIIDKVLGRPMPVVHRVHFLRTAWFRYAAAIIIICGIGAYLYTTNKQKEKPLVAESTPIENDILPGRNKAVLIFADGSRMELDSTADGKLTAQGSSTIMKKDGQIFYRNEELEGVPSGSSGGSDVRPNTDSRGLSLYNTMATPKAGTYRLTLPDGTKAWLNAESSITFPTAFIQKERVVKITGEVYFEVKKNPSKPFIVKTSDEEITVLGTSFNVNTYPDEQNNKTSLLEGSVKISNIVLKPGQAYANGKIVATNIEQDIAWKNGYFNFTGANLAMVMRQLARWYDIEVEYTGRVPVFDFQGELPKSLTLSQVLKILERMDVKFTVQGRKLIVSP